MASAQTKGMVTWTRTLVYGGTSFVYAVNLYDDKGRVIQVKSTNHTGTNGKDVVTTQYNWAGQPLRVVQRTAYAAGSLGTVLTDFSYDDRAGPCRRRRRCSTTKSQVAPCPPPGRW